MKIEIRTITYSSVVDGLLEVQYAALPATQKEKYVYAGNVPSGEKVFALVNFIQGSIRVL